MPTVASVELPPPPRPLPTTAGWSAYWPCGAVGAVCAFFTVVIAVILYGAGLPVLPFGDVVFASGAARATVRGRVEAVESVVIHTPRGNLQRVHYSFEPMDAAGDERRDETVHGTQTVLPEDARGLRAGDDILIEHALADPAHNRIDGIEPPSLVLHTLLAILAAAALVLLCWWLRAMLRARLVLREGLETSARVTAARRVPLFSPPRLRLSLHYVTHEGRAVESRVSVAEDSAVGRAWRERAGSDDARDLFVGVVYDAREPRHVRLADEARR